MVKGIHVQGYIMKSKSSFPLLHPTPKKLPMSTISCMPFKKNSTQVSAYGLTHFKVIVFTQPMHMLVFIFETQQPLGIHLSGLGSSFLSMKGFPRQSHPVLEHCVHHITSLPSHWRFPSGQRWKSKLIKLTLKSHHNRAPVSFSTLSLPLSIINPLLESGLSASTYY